MKPISKEKIEEFKRLAEPITKFLKDNYHPHVKVIITPESAEILANEIYIPIEEAKQKPIKNPCIVCGKEWDSVKTWPCPHCGNKVPF